MHRFSLIVSLLAIFLTGCSSSPDFDDPTHGMSAAQIYQEAKANLNDANYETAIQYYEKLESRFPYGNYATRAQMEVLMPTTNLMNMRPPSSPQSASSNCTPIMPMWTTPIIYAAWQVIQ